MRRRAGALMLVAALIPGGCGAKPPAVGQGGSETETGSEKGVTGVVEPVTLEEVTERNTGEIWEGYQRKLDENEIADSSQTGLDASACESAVQILQGAEESVNYSPLSLCYALAMVGAGVDGKTLEGISGLPGVKEWEEPATQSGNIYQYLCHQQGFHEVYQEEHKSGLGEEKRSEVLIANSLWAGGKIELEPDYVSQLTDQYYASIHWVPFARDETWEEVGQWIKEKTDGVLESELTKDEETVLALINTLYYYGSRKNKFPEETTKPDTLTGLDSSEVTTDFMNITVTGYPCREGDGYRTSMINIGNNTSMVLILSDEGRDISELSAAPEKPKEALNGEYETMEASWEVPKSSFGSNMKPEDTLRRLGAGDMFEVTAGFSCMTNVPALVSNVIQETYTSMDESGVKGAAHTMMVLAGYALIEETKMGDIIPNRPFLLGIRSDEVGWLFIEVVKTP